MQIQKVSSQEQKQAKTQRQIYLNYILSQYSDNQQQETSKYQHFLSKLTLIKQGSIQETNQTFFSNLNHCQDQNILIEELKQQIQCLYKQKQSKYLSYQQTIYNSQKIQDKFACCNFSCDKYPWICGDQQCICFQDHLKCKTTKSDKIISLLVKKLLKPVQKQILMYLKCKYYLWEYMKDIISQEKQILFEIYEQIKQKNIQSIDRQDLQIYLYQQSVSNQKFNQQICCQRKVIKLSEIKQYHKKCKCQARKINLNNQQISIAIFKEAFQQYNKIFDFIQNQILSIENLLIMANLNLFERIIFAQLKSINSQILTIKDYTYEEKIRLSGHLIFKTLQYSQYQFNDQKILIKTNLKLFHFQWKQIWQPDFHFQIQINILKGKFLQFQKQQQKQINQNKEINFLQKNQILFKIKLLSQSMKRNQKDLIYYQIKQIKNALFLKNNGLQNLAQYMLIYQIKNSFFIQPNLNQIFYQEVLRISQNKKDINISLCFDIYSVEYGQNILVLDKNHFFKKIHYRKQLGAQQMMIFFFKQLKIKKINYIALPYLNQGQTISKDLLQLLCNKIEKQTLFLYYWDFSVQDYQFLVKKQKKFKNLKIKIKADQILNQPLQDIIAKNQNLQSISLEIQSKNNQQIQINKYLQQLSSRAQNLKVFEVQYTSIININQDLFFKFIKRMNNLQKLNINSCSDSVFVSNLIQTVADSCKKLTEISFDWMKDLNISFIFQMHSLKKFYFAYSSMTDPLAFSEGIKNLKFLKKLDLSGNDQLNDQMFDGIGQLINLQYLSICNCKNIRGQGLLKLKKLSLLKEFAFGWAIFEEKYLIQLSKFCKNIKLLSIYQYTLLSQKGLLEIDSNLQLKCITLWNISQIKIDCLLRLRNVRQFICQKMTTHYNRQRQCDKLEKFKKRCKINQYQS